MVVSALKKPQEQGEFWNRPLLFTSLKSHYCECENVRLVFSGVISSSNPSAAKKPTATKQKRQITVAAKTHVMVVPVAGETENETELEKEDTVSETRLIETQVNH